jgi:predicted ribosome quality control (RQC) complex YloA/Tae2 family protein
VILLFAGAIVQRVDVGPALVLLRLRAPGKTRWVVIAAGPRGRVGVLADKPWKGAGIPGGSSAQGEKIRFRMKVDGARIEAIGPRGVQVSKGDARVTIAIVAGVIKLVDGSVEDAAGEDAEEAWLADGEALASALGEGALAARRQELSRALAKGTARIGRRIEAIRGDLGRIAEADGIAAQASSFVAAAARAPRGARELTVTDWSNGEPRSITLAIDPARPALAQVEAMFKRARRLKVGAAIAGKRLGEAESASAKLTVVKARLAEAATLEAIEPLVREARAAAPRDFALAEAGTGGAGREPRAGVTASRPFKLFLDESGERILVGRGAAHNDALTFKVARPHDLWLHAKGQKGAHVIVPLEKNRTCPGELLVDAAHLAAHFSDAREEGVVEVQYTPRRHLRKPRGSAPGLVVVDREKVLVLRVERDRVARLLGAEQP